MQRRFKDEHGDEWYVYRQPAATFGASNKGYFPEKTRRPGFKFRNLRTDEMRFLKEEDAPKDLNVEKADEAEWSSPGLMDIQFTLPAVSGRVARRTRPVSDTRDSNADAADCTKARDTQTASGPRGVG